MPMRKKDNFSPTPQPRWRNPHEPVPPEEISGPADKPSILDAALAVFGPDAETETVSNQLLAAIILAQALDRLSEKIAEAAIVGRYRGT